MSALGRLRLAGSVTQFVLRHPGVRSARRAAILRALRWQAARRRPGVRGRLEVGPARLYCYPHSTGATGLLYVGLPEWDEMGFMLRYLRPGDRFADVGANVGSWSILAATWVADVEVTAFEPGEPSATRLEENVALNRAERVRLVRSAVGAATGEVSFTTGLDSTNHVAPAGGAGTVQVPMVTLDDALSEPPTLIKIDVEGTELDVLLGAQRLLTGLEPPALVFEVGARGAAADPILRHVEDLGYVLCRFDASAAQLEPRHAGDEQVHGDGVENVVAVPDLDAARRRIDASPIARELFSPVPVRLVIERR